MKADENQWRLIFCQLIHSYLCSVQDRYLVSKRRIKASLQLQCVWSSSGTIWKSHAIIRYHGMYLKHHTFRHLSNHPITWSGHNVQNHVDTYFTYFSQSALEWGTMHFYTDFDCDMVVGAKKSSLSISETADTFRGSSVALWWKRGLRWRARQAWADRKAMVTLYNHGELKCISQHTVGVWARTNFTPVKH